MLNNDYLKKILEALVAQGSEDGVNYYDTNEKSTTSSFHLSNETPYLVLFKKMPNLEGQGGEEISLKGYEPLPLTNQSIEGKHFFESAPELNENDEILITNTSPIQMHSIDETEENEQEILGFGIVDSNMANKILIAWGRLQDDQGHLVKSAEEASPAEGTAPKLTGGGVPIFDPGTLTLAFSNSEGGLEEELQKNLLKMIVNYHDGTNPTQRITFNSYYPKVALFTDLEEKEEPDITGYTRKNLYGFTPTVAPDEEYNGLQFKESAFIEGTTGSVERPGEAYAKIKNTNEIQMSAITGDTDGLPPIKVYGFGIFAQDDPNDSSSTRLVAWGPLVDENDKAVDFNSAPTLSKGSVPIFYKEKFKMQLGGENTETYIALDKMELDLYKLLREEPADWSEKYQDYYTRENIKFSPNTDLIWDEEKEYYKKVNEPIYELIVEEPADFSTTPYLYYKELEENKFVPATQRDQWASGTYYKKTSNNTGDITAEDPNDLYYLGVDFKPGEYTGQPTFISSNLTAFSVDDATGAIDYKQENGQKGTFTAILNQKETKIGTLEYTYRNPKIADVQFTIQGEEIQGNDITFRKVSGKQNKIISISFIDANKNFTNAEQNSLVIKTATIENKSYNVSELTPTVSDDAKTIDLFINNLTSPSSGIMGTLVINYTCNAFKNLPYLPPKKYTIRYADQ